MPLVRKPAGPSAPPTPDDSAVLQALQSANADERWAAARAAAVLPDGVRQISAALQVEADPRVREAMLTSLARSGTSESAQALLPLLRSNDAALRTGALDALRIMAVSIKELLPGLLQDPDVDVRILSCELARAIPADEATNLLCELLDRERDVNVCAAAIDVVAEVGGPEAAPALARCAQRFSDSPFVAFAATTTIELLNSRSVSPRG